MPQITVSDQNQIGRAINWLTGMLVKGLESGPVVVSVDREKRTTDQNRKLWPMLHDIARQVTWYGAMHSEEVWKDLITGTFRQCKVLPNLDGTGFVMTGLSTSKLSKADFSALIEYIYAFGADRDVKWSEPSLQAFAEYREAQQ
jgi:hypothetical protein